MATLTPSSLEEKIQDLAQKYSQALLKQIDCRLEEMKGDDTSHFLIYRVLGVTEQEGRLIDIYQNKGRFLYKYAGSFLEKATQLSFLEKYPNSKSIKIANRGLCSNRTETYAKAKTQLQHRFWKLTFLNKSLNPFCTK